MSNATVKKFNINTATVDEMKTHPYIRYNIANAIFGGTAPLMALLSVQMTGSKLAPAFLVLGMAGLSFISVILLYYYRLSLIPLTNLRNV